VRGFALRLLVFSCSPSAFATEFAADFKLLIAKSCIDCHKATTKTRLNLGRPGHDLANADTFRQWEKIFDRAD